MRNSKNNSTTTETNSVNYPQWDLKLARKTARNNTVAVEQEGQRHVVSSHEICGQYFAQHSEREQG